ncbi:hypothetical protein CFP65_1032 [Kitasatospora sp. MMS16-BH015]|uniref:hypothetical protein n=1 Tax=Kitasatospora sp. MMS16-BH015 TaxID=2018025 RepID=UPI000CA36F79|nr:hypothetical protein [Kitasatospora sp. MMS16-BH015]AUG75950.1 hypothetical protein CFP65_1032 [Kitasatospora sp. MMS16-BH015]
MRPRVVYVTDFDYPAKGRDYGAEDRWLTARLEPEFEVVTCPPAEVTGLMGGCDAVVVRNSGPVLHHREVYEEYTDRARRERIRVYNPLSGKADMAGKGYLVELTAAGYPVIPTAEAGWDGLPEVPEYVVKPVQGADSIGMAVLPAAELERAELAGMLVQPKVDFAYEVSFYFVDQECQYALYAPDPAARWLLERYEPSEADLAFAQRFVEWNGLPHGIQRVDACRTAAGELLLVELEDLNPYLSLELLDEETRERFVAAFTRSLHGLLAAPRPAAP